MTAEKTSVISFVRDTLGCGCPDEVFSKVLIEPQPRRFAGLPVVAEVAIGGRLLVVVCAATDWRDDDGRLAKVISAGRRARDDSGFNRVRIVVPASDPAALESALHARFATLAGSDPRAFLHVVEPSRIPRPLGARDGDPRPTTGPG